MNNSDILESIKEVVIDILDTKILIILFLLRHLR